MNTALDGRPVVVPPRGGSAARRIVAGMLLPVIIAAIAVIGLRVPASAPFPAAAAVAFGLVLVGALSAAVLGRARR